MEKFIKIIAFVLLVIGGLNWALVGIADFNLVTALLGVTIFAKLVYILIGAAAVYAVVMSFKHGSCCSK